MFLQIEQDWVLTAAHCCAAYSSMVSAAADQFKIRVGEHDLLQEYEPNAVTYDLEKIIMHPEYVPDDSTTAYDMCLVKTKMVFESQLKEPLYQLVEN